MDGEDDEASVSVATATAATVNHTKAVIASNIYHVANPNDIPAKQNG
jgi:hypothetical protein